MSFDLILGSHSIHHALINKERKNFELCATKQGLSDFRNKYGLDSKVKIQTFSPGELTNASTRLANELGFKVGKVPSGIFLKCSKLDFIGNAWAHDFVSSNDKVKFIALDRVTDIHNAAAIMRTAAFFNVDGLIVGSKAAFSLTPGFFRIASGAYEYVKLVHTPSLSKTLGKLSEKGVSIIGFSEEVASTQGERSEKSCLVFGAEEQGLSHAVERQLTQHVQLETTSPINSLNVSVAASLGMNRFF